MASLIDGKKIAELVRKDVAERVIGFQRRHGRAPALHVVLVGEDPGSAAYVRGKEKASSEVGILSRVHRLPGTTREAELLALVEVLNTDPSVDGILVQFPVPDGIRESAVLSTIRPEKDVDGLTTASVGALWSGQPGLVACTPRGCLRLLREIGAPLEGAHAVVVGRSNLVGKPVAALLLREHATVTLAHSKTRDLAAICRSADVLVTAVGRPRLFGAEFVKPGAVVIDVGITRDPNGKLWGDVDFAAVEPIASAITPVPGGVGPMTIAMLLENTLLAAEARAAASASSP